MSARRLRRPVSRSVPSSRSMRRCARASAAIEPSSVARASTSAAVVWVFSESSRSGFSAVEVAATASSEALPPTGSGSAATIARWSVLPLGASSQEPGAPAVAAEPSGPSASRRRSAIAWRPSISQPSSTVASATLTPGPAEAGAETAASGMSKRTMPRMTPPSRIGTTRATSGPARSDSANPQLTEPIGEASARVASRRASAGPGRGVPGPALHASWAPAVVVTQADALGMIE